jgi:hypothetical protein
MFSLEGWRLLLELLEMQLYSCAAEPGCLYRIQGQKNSGSRIQIRIKEFKYYNPKHKEFTCSPAAKSLAILSSSVLTIVGLLGMDFPFLELAGAFVVLLDFLILVFFFVSSTLSSGSLQTV